MSISQIDHAVRGQRVTMQGEVASLTPPRTDRAPYSIMLRDATGIIRVAIWKDLWDSLPFREQIRDGAKLTVRGEIADFRGSLEAHPSAPDDVKLGLADSAAASRGPSLAAVNSPGAGFKVVSADLIQWQTDLASALKRAAETQKNILVFFENPDVEASRQVAANIFADARVRAAVNEKCVAVRVSMATQRDLAQRLGAVRAGIVILYKPDGTAIKRLDTLTTPEDLIRQLP
jgi:hypothetical protein